MGKEAAMRPSPLHHGYEKIDDDSSSVAELESTEEKVQELEHIIHEEIDQASIIQAIQDDCIIPSPALKGIATVTFFGPDLKSAFQLLGAKYNNMVKKNQDQASEMDTLRNKCLVVCKPQYEELKQKYTRECTERKRFYNELIELKGNIRVFCRCRPLRSDEISKGCTSVLDFDPSVDSELQIICADSSRRQFKFDRIFGPMDNQETLFAEILPIVNSVLDGYNVCIFAYGQTGTGKTFTMEGDPDNRGVNYRALEELFKSSKERSSMTKYDFSVSMLEVYNEKIRDLLAENSDQAAKKLEIKQAADGTQDVPGLVESLACSTDEVWEMLKTGSRNRSVGSTIANKQSSRSHCLVRVTIIGENLVKGQRSRSHLWLVDLAGSERVGKIEAEGERLKESQFINKSLSALGDVISALATKNSSHIPYRNSKLTYLLQSSLGGDCKTLMFAQISPSSADLGETLCSLNFASRVRGIVNGPAHKQSDPAETVKLKQMVRDLENQVRDLENQLAEQRKPGRQVRDLENQLGEHRKPRRQVRHLENQLAEQTKPVHQLKFRIEEARDSAEYYRPPPSPIDTRPGDDDKENMSMTGKGDRARGIKARKFSLFQIRCPVPIQPKSRATIAILPSKLGKPPSVRETEEQNINSSESTLTPLRAVGVAATPDRRDKLSNFPASSSKVSGPTLQQLCKSKISHLGSQRQRRRQVPGPGSSTILGIVDRVFGAAATPDRRDKLSNFPASSSKVTSPALGIADRVLFKSRRRKTVI